MAISAVGLHLAYSVRTLGNHPFPQRFVVKITILVLFLVCGMAIARAYVSSSGTAANGRTHLVSRVKALLDFQISDDGSLMDDGSVQDRLGAQQVYWKMIAARPWWGYGMGSEAYFSDTGTFVFTSHSTILSGILEYGVFYPFAFVLLMAQMYRNRRRASIENAFATNTVAQFVFITLVLFVVNGNLLTSRVFFIVWGMLFGMIHSPTELLRLTPRTSPPATQSTHRLVRRPPRRERIGTPCHGR